MKCSCIILFILQDRHEIFNTKQTQEKMCKKSDGAHYANKNS